MPGEGFWFARSRSFRPFVHAIHDVLTTLRSGWSGGSHRRRIAIILAARQHRPDATRHLVGQCHCRQHRRLAFQQVREPWVARHAPAQGPADQRILTQGSKNDCPSIARRNSQRSRAVEICTRDGWAPVLFPPSLALAKPFSGSGCGGIFALFSGVMREGLLQ